MREKIDYPKVFYWKIDMITIYKSITINKQSIIFTNLVHILSFVIYELFLEKLSQ